VEEKEREEKGRGGKEDREGGRSTGPTPGTAPPSSSIHVPPAHAIVVRPSKVSRHVNVTSGRILEYECD
jgi:hypothetical protein